MRVPLILSALLISAASAATAPPGFNVHLVDERGGRRVWRGGAPKPETLRTLAAEAKRRGVTVTLIDLRTPPNADDRSGKGGRLSPADEAIAAKRAELRYLPVSALDRSLPDKLRQARKVGDVYIHCMYGVNRTGFAVARYARAEGVKPDRKGLGKRDWSQGDAFQSRLSK